MKRLLTLITLSIIFLQNYSFGYDFTDNVPPSQNPPGGLDPSEVPMFVSFGFDDLSNTGYYPFQADNTGGTHWIIDFLKDKNNPSGNNNPATYDGEPARVSFFLTSVYVTQSSGSDFCQKIKWVLNQAYLDGHEVGNHTQTHNMAYQTSPHENIPQSHWESEIAACNTELTKPTPEMGHEDIDYFWAEYKDQGVGLAKEDVYGFRSPFLKYNDKLFTVLKNEGIAYDCSIEEGLQYGLTIDNFYWPYTLDNGSPAHTYLKDNGIMNFSLSSHPGVWELPAYAVVVPTDDACADYGIPSGLRASVKARKESFNVDEGKITGLDMNMFGIPNVGGHSLTKTEALATFKYSLDMRMQGNRSPMLFGAHPNVFTSKWNGGSGNTATDRREVIEEFIDYALTTYPEVRIVPFYKVMKWMQNPIPLSSTPIKDNLSNSNRKRQVKIFGIKNNTLSFSVPQNGTYNISIISPNGRVLYEKEKYCNNIKVENISFSNIKNNGIFFVSIHMNGTFKTVNKLIAK